MTVKERFIEDLTVLSKASVPLIVVKTREPHRALEAIEDYVYNHNFDLVEQNKRQQALSSVPFAYGYWNCLSGWWVKEYDRFDYTGELEEQDHEIVSNGVTDPVKAFRLLLARRGSTITDDLGTTEQDKAMGLRALPQGVYAMSWPHPAFESPTVKTALLEVAFRFPTEHKRLILVLPETADIPSDLLDYVTYLEYKSPCEEERRELISFTFDQYDLNTELYDFKPISDVGAGMTAFELGNSVSRSLQTTATECKINGTHLKNTIHIDRICKDVMVHKTEMIKRTNVLSIMPSIDMDNVGGLENLKSWIYDRKNCFSAEAAAFGIDKPNGIALLGPPGTGKSLCAQAIGSTLGFPVIRFDVSAVFGKYVGESEARMRSVLKVLESLSYCVVVVDEVDKIFNKNDNSSSGVADRILGMILTFMQNSTAPVFWVLTGNRAAGLPSEMLRKGRLDEVFCVTIPNDDERLAIVSIHLKKRGKDPAQVENLEYIIEHAKGYVASELEVAVNQSIIHSFNTGEQITGELIIAKLKSSKPLSEAFEADFEAMQSWAEMNAMPASLECRPKGLVLEPSVQTNNSKPRNTRSRKVV